jgi:hypothetical protein
VNRDGSGSLSFIDGKPVVPRPLEAPPGAADASFCVPDDSGGAPRCVQGLFSGGLEYALKGVRSDGARLQATAVAREPWNEWCALQTPRREPDYTLEDGSVGGCLFDHGPNYSVAWWDDEACTMEVAGNIQPIDCLYLHALIAVPCACRVDGCGFDGVAHTLQLVRSDDEGLIGVLDSSVVDFQRE